MKIHFPKRISEVKTLKNLVLPQVRKPLRESWRRHCVTVGPPRGGGVYASNSPNKIHDTRRYLGKNKKSGATIKTSGGHLPNFQESVGREALKGGLDLSY